MGKQLQWLKLKQLKLGQIQIDGIKRGFERIFRFGKLKSHSEPNCKRRWYVVS